MASVALLPAEIRDAIREDAANVVLAALPEAPFAALREGHLHWELEQRFSGPGEYVACKKLQAGWGVLRFNDDGEFWLSLGKATRLEALQAAVEGGGR